MIAGDTGGPDQALEKIPAEARGMLGGQADVLVEVKHLHHRPVEIRLAHEPIEKRHL
jgi:hypothetical protein